MGHHNLMCLFFFNAKTKQEGPGLRDTARPRLWECMREYSWKCLTKVGRPTPNVGGTNPRAGDSDLRKREKGESRVVGPRVFSFPIRGRVPAMPSEL